MFLIEISMLVVSGWNLGDRSESGLVLAGNVHLKQALVNTHFPVVVGLASFTVWSLANRDDEAAGWKWNRTSRLIPPNCREWS